MNDSLDDDEDNSEQLNEAQRRRLLSSVSYIDKLLMDTEQILAASASGGFPKYKNPLSPIQARVAHDYIKRLRQQILHVLANLEVSLPEARFDSTFSIQVTLQFVEVALEEIAPERLTGFGSVPESLVRPLAGGIQKMKGIVRQMNSYLIQRADADLSSRLLRLPEFEADSGFLRELGSIIDRHGLIEFRASLSQLVEKIETPAYEIAFFGRVSAGKSSLLNRIIGLDLLPTGVTPITAVPTRIKNGLASQLLVWTADGRLSEYGSDRLADFATEAGNPGNEKHVTRLLVEMPLPILPNEVVLVDTPGLGSLALEGAVQTLAYLPRCDLGVVLVDGSSNLHADDVATVDALRAASVPALVVLSKVDLLMENDRARLIDYTRTQLDDQLGTEVHVAPLSTRSELAGLLEDWIRNEIAPRVADARRLARESNQRKARNLGQRLLRALEISAKASTICSPDTLSHELSKAEGQLRTAASVIESTRAKCFKQTDRIRDAGEPAIRWLAEKAVIFWGQEPQSSQIGNAWVAKHVHQLAQAEAEQVAHLIQRAACELAGALDEAARTLSIGEPEDRFDLQTFVKEMPSIEFSVIAGDLKRPILFSVSTGWARRSVQQELEKQLGGRLIQFFKSYGHAIEVWARTSLNSLAGEFETHADVYRAQLQRLSSTGPVTNRGSNESIFQDMAFLREKLGLEEIAQSLESSAER